MKITYYNQVTSTNDLLLEMARSESDMDDRAVLAFSQTKGRGRRGRSFFSPDSTGIYLSLLLHPNIEVSKAQYITTLMAVAACEALEKRGSLAVGIKWVNDLYINERKVSGILTECSGTFKGSVPDYVVVGIGVNLYDPMEGLPEDIKDRAGSVFGPLPSNISRDELDCFRKNLANEIIDRFLYYYQNLLQKEWYEGYVGRMFLKNRTVVAFDNDNHTENLKVIGVDEEFGLIAEKSDGNVCILRSGEVSLKI